MQRDSARIRFKLCGLTRKEDIGPMVHSGADAIGLVFDPSSKRYVSLQLATDLCAQIPAFVTVTGLFVNSEADFFNTMIEQAGGDLVQLKGGASTQFC